MVCGTPGFRGTPVGNHCPRMKQERGRKLPLYFLFLSLSLIRLHSNFFTSSDPCPQEHSHCLFLIKDENVSQFMLVIRGM